MRDILFRGKRVDNGEWVQGFYLSSPEFDNKGIAVITVDKPRTPCYVYKETIGQYTGLTDKNGKKIFEGDIVKDLGGYMDGIPRAVVWDEGTMEFETYLVRKHWAYGTNRVRLWLIKDRELEVIGNIHDNPELLGE